MLGDTLNKISRLMYILQADLEHLQQQVSPELLDISEPFFLQQEQDLWLINSAGMVHLLSGLHQL